MKTLQAKDRDWLAYRHADAIREHIRRVEQAMRAGFGVNAAKKHSNRVARLHLLQGCSQASMSARLCLLLVLLAASILGGGALPMPTTGAFSGVGTYSQAAGNGAGWACEGRTPGHPGLPTVAINAVQFGMGAACGACIEVTGTGKGEGSTPMTGTFKVTVTNILTQGSSGDLDFPKTGSGQWGIKWSFIECPGAVSTSRRMLTA
ncbi:hypothetical protein WJX73_000819 [Symbiochloris irregularis]|uniref:Expansin-like EG45 domain-containing protein n=1 Tax=Symbiochloris irregularis TaxID=706552 RepID=A0AAW1NWU0_9CHLO